MCTDVYVFLSYRQFLSCGHPSLLQDCHLDQGGLTVLGKGIELSIIVSYPCANPFLHESHSPNMHIPIREGGISSPPCLPGTSCIILKLNGLTIR